MREIRTLRATWRGLETWHGRDASTLTGAPVLDPTCERPEVKFLRPTHHETFNVLKTNGYNLEHNFGHGKETLASVLVVLNLLAFGFHTAAMLAVLAWRQAVIARGATYRFFEHLRTITAYVIFQDWDHLLRSITAAAIRPP
jgi:hypothetical protein